MLSRCFSSCRIPALVLSAVLQMMPLVRQALPALQSSGNLMAIVFRWGVGAAAALGSVHAVSGASTVITTPLNQTVTNGVPLGNSQIRLITAPDQAHYWTATGLPSGLYLTNTSSTAWYIRGTPVQQGTFNVALVGKDQASSGADRTATATMILTVLPGSGGGNNSPPVASTQSVTTAEDTARTITLSGNDPDGDPLTYAIVTQPAHGVLSGNAPNLTYRPATNYAGPDSFTFRVSDGTTNSAPAPVSINITAVNDAPVANAQSIGTPENTGRAIMLTGSDVEGSILSFSVVTPPTHGLLTGTPPNVTYTPTASFSGNDEFTFKVNDGSLDSLPATVSITVSSVNSPPLASPQNVSTFEDTATAITLSGADPNGDPLTFTVLTQPSHGALSGIVPNLTYTPATNYAGPDSFTFRVNDGTTNSAFATIAINITAVNDAPMANAQTVSTAEDTPKAITLSGSDVEGSSLSYVIVSQPTHGTLSGSPPSLNYRPATNYHGPDSFSFKVNDGSLDSLPASVSITVTPVNDPPVAPALTTAAASGSQIVLDLLSAVSDPDGDTLNLVSILPTNGTAVISGNGTVQFTSTSNFVGTAYLGYTVSDGHGGAASGLVTITVTAAPVTQFSVQAGSVSFNPQTGLYEQQVTVANTGSGTAAAVRLKVSGLRAGVTLYNAAGQESGVPYAQYNAALNPGQNVILRLEFYVPDRQTFTSTLSAEAVLPESSTADPNAGLAIDRNFMDRTDPSNPRFTIEFTTVPGRVYTVIYTDNMVSWKAATPSFTATATRTQWHDDGPPKTDSKPGGGRFYRVIGQ